MRAELSLPWSAPEVRPECCSTAQSGFVKHGDGGAAALNNFVNAHFFLEM